VPRVRALFVGLEGLTGTLLQPLVEKETGCEIVASLPDHGGLLQAIRQYSPDLLVVGLQDDDVESGWDRLFREYPALRVLAVTPHGRRACLFRDPTAEGFLAALKRVVPEAG